MSSISPACSSRVTHLEGYSRMIKKSKIVSLLALKDRITYGPVNSRRLGKSLGINLFLSNRKICSFNCLYCQYGITLPDSFKLMNENIYPSATEVTNAVEKALKKLDPKPDYITFSGNGEPSMHPDFPAIVDAVNAARNRVSPGSKTAILSNSSLLEDKRKWEAISKLDEKIMKLDAGSEAAFQRYNLPCYNMKLDDIVENLRRIPGVTIQSLFSGGEAGNSSSREVGMWVRRIKYINPKHVQIYTLARGYPSKKIQPLSKEELLNIKILLDSENISSTVY